MNPWPRKEETKIMEQNENYYTIVSQLMQFITDNFPLTEGDSLNPEDNLIEEGVLDSLGLFGVIEFIEESFGFEVANEDVVIENFGSVASMAQYILGVAKGVGEAGLEKPNSGVSDLGCSTVTT